MHSSNKGDMGLRKYIVRILISKCVSARSRLNTIQLQLIQIRRFEDKALRRRVFKIASSRKPSPESAAYRKASNRRFYTRTSQHVTPARLLHTYRSSRPPVRQLRPTAATKRSSGQRMKTSVTCGSFNKITRSMFELFLCRSVECQQRENSDTRPIGGVNFGGNSVI